MNFEDKILDLFDEYFRSAPKEEIENDVNYINSIGMNGVSYEEYLTILNGATSYNLRDNGICDDIAFADLFNSTICQIQMGELQDIRIGEEPIVIKWKPSNIGNTTYALAA
jgi:hypothetical protein